MRNNFKSSAKKSFAMLLSASMVLQSMSQYTLVYAEETTPVVELQDDQFVQSDDMPVTDTDVIPVTDDSESELEVTDETIYEDVAEEEVVTDEASYAKAVTEKTKVELTEEELSDTATELTLKITNTEGVAKDDYIELTAPTTFGGKNVIKYDQVTSGDLLTIGGQFIGKYTVQSDGKIKITYNDGYDANTEGYIRLTGKFVAENLPETEANMTWNAVPGTSSVVYIKLPAAATDISNYKFNNVKFEGSENGGSVIWIDGNEKVKPVAKEIFADNDDFTITGKFIPYAQEASELGPLSYPTNKAIINSIYPGEGSVYEYTISRLPSTGTYNGQAGYFEWTVTNNWSDEIGTIKGYVKDDTYSGEENVYLVKTKSVNFNVEVRYDNATASELAALKALIEGLPLGKSIDKDTSYDETIGKYFNVTVSGHNLVVTSKADLPAFSVPDGNAIIYFMEAYNNGIKTGDSYKLGDINYLIDLLNNANYAHPSYKNPYEGGKLIFTVDAVVDAVVTKNWGDAADPSQRPVLTMTLYRYSKREGQSYKNGAPVYNSDNVAITRQVGSDKSVASEEVSVENLPKYDREGYEYQYYYVENLPAGSRYEQRFDDDIYGRDRDENDNSIYNGESITNAIAGQVVVEGTKTWVANSLQSQFKNISVTYQLQSRVKDTEDWTDVTGKTMTIEGFSNSVLTKSDKVEANKYDNQGNELEYRWVEVSVTQDGETIELDENGYFTLQQKLVSTGDVQTVHYKASQVDSATDTGYKSDITNKLAEDVTVNVEKHWIGVEDGNYPPITLRLKLENKELYSDPFTIEFDENGVAKEQYRAFKFNGEDVTLKITPNSDTGYDIQFSGLSHFDENGTTLDYAAYEVPLNGVRTTYSFETDDMGNVYEDVSNDVRPGPGGQEIVIMKDWIDGEDTTYRPNIQADVYYHVGEGENIKLNDEPITLSEDTGWMEYFYFNIENYGVTEPYNFNNLFVNEVSVGGYVPTQIELDTIFANRNTKASIGQYVYTSDRKYDVLYSAYFDTDVNRNTTLITNKRIGDVKVDVTKEWVDGTGEVRKELKDLLDSKQATLGYVVTYSVGGEVNKTFLPVSFDTKEATVQFYDDDNAVYLPKYNANGAAYTYTTEEVVQVGDTYVAVGEWIDANAFANSAVRDYVATLGDPETVNLDTDIIADEYHYQSSNQLTGSKDIQYHIEWKDDYQDDHGNRFDVSIELYKEMYKDDGTVAGYESIYRNGKWTKEADFPDPESVVYRVRFSDLPKYDANGYEIKYYAIQHTAVDKDTFDYIEPTYKDTDGTTVIGSESTDLDPETNKVVQVLPGKYAIEEDGYILNQLDRSITLNADKVWKSLPLGYRLSDLPKVQFVVTQVTYDKDHPIEKDKPEYPEELWPKQVATFTIEPDEWETVARKMIFLYEGENNLPHRTDTEYVTLKRYDSEGRRLNYTIDEVITYTYNDGETGTIFVKDESHASFANIYEPADQISVNVGKYIDLASYDKEKTPNVTFGIIRSYKGNPDGSNSVPTRYDHLAMPITLSFDQFSEKGDELFTYANVKLAKYAPNGDEYQYYIYEVPVNGYKGFYDTAYKSRNNQGFPNSGKGFTGAYSTQDGEYVDIPEGYRILSKYAIPVADEDYLTFSNRYDSKKTYVAFQKKWIDNNNANNTRKDLTFKITRTARGNGGNPETQDFSFTVTSEMLRGTVNTVKLGEAFDVDNLVLTIESADGKDLDKANLISYTVGLYNEEGQLEIDATNGSPWIYTVEETSKIDGYNILNGNGQMTTDPAHAVLVNSFETSVELSKIWMQDGKEVKPKNNSNSTIVVIADLYATTDDGATWQKVQGSAIEDPIKEYAQTQGYTSFELSRSFSYNENTEMGKKTVKMDHLPTSLVVSGKKVELNYALVETKISYNGGNTTNELDPKVTGTAATGKVHIHYDDSSAYNVMYTAVLDYDFDTTKGLAISTGNTASNTFEKTKVSVDKTYADDASNKWHTRGNSAANGNSTISFVLQRSTDNVTWEQIGAVQTLTFAKGDTKNSVTTSDLPMYTMIQEGDTWKKAKYTYRYLELQPGNTNVVNATNATITVADGASTITTTNAASGTYNNTYSMVAVANPNGEAINNSFTNTMDVTSIDFDKTFIQDYVTNKKPATFTLQYKKADGTWGNVVYYNDSNVATNVTLTLDGTADSAVNKHGAQETSAWHGKFDNIPKVYPGSTTNADGITVYRVLETTNNYAFEVSAQSEGNNATIQNELTELKVEKKLWQPSAFDATQEFEFRVTSSNANDKETYSVIFNGNNSTQTSITLGNNSTNTFKLKNNEYAVVYGLNKNNTYTVAEINSGAWAVYDGTGKLVSAQSKKITVAGADNNKLTFQNVKTGKITVIKKGQVLGTNKQYAQEGLLGAEFVIRADSTVAADDMFNGSSLTNGQYLKKDGTKWTTVASTDAADVFRTNASGQVVVEQLPLGTYTVIETKAPDGYVIADPVTVEITKDNTSASGVIAVNANYTDDPRLEYNADLTKYESAQVLVKKLAGAEFKLYAAANITKQNSPNTVIYKENDVVMTVTTDQDGYAQFENIPYGTFYVKETKAPNGYELNKNKLFTITTNADGTTTVTSVDGTATVDETTGLVSITDVQIDLHLVKTDGQGTDIEGDDYAVFKVTGEFASGATEFYVTNNKDKTKYEAADIVLTNMSSMKGEWIYGKEYTFEEIYAPQGYELAPATYKIVVNDDGTAKVTADSAKIVEVRADEIRVKDETIHIEETKVETGKSDPIDTKEDHAIFEVSGKFKNDTKATTKLVSKYGSDTVYSFAELDGLWVGGQTYKFTETYAPKGFKLADPFDVTVGTDGTLTLSTPKPAFVDVINGTTLKIQDDPITIVINKVTGMDKDAMTPIGANDQPEFEINGVFATLGDTTVTKKANELSTLDKEWVANESYTFTETYAPKGYEIADPFTISVDDYGVLSENPDVSWVQIEDNKIIVNDVELNIDLVKLDGTTKLSGAEVEIKGPLADGRKSIKFVIDSDEVDLNVLLIGGQHYTIQETKAPDGYKRNANIVGFTVDKKGNITIDENDLNKGYTANGDTISLQNTQIVVGLNKVDGDDSSIETTTDHAVFQVDGSFVDKSTSKYVSNGTNGYSQPTVTFLSLNKQWIYGNTYSFTEVYAPEGYKLAGAFSIAIDESGILSVVDAASHPWVKIVNNSIVVTDEQIEIDLSKQDENGNPLTGAQLTITGHFADNETSKTVTVDNTKELVGVIVADEEYAVVEAVAPNGYKLNTNVFKFTVNANGIITATQAAQGYDIVNNAIVVTDNGIQIELVKLGEGVVINDKSTGTDLAKFTLVGRFDAPTNAPSTIENVTAQNMSQFNSRWLQSSTTKYVYSMTETYAPTGYTTNATFYFIVKTDGNIELTDAEGNKTTYANVTAATNVVSVNDLKNQIVINKVDETGKQLAGAKLQIKKGDSVELEFNSEETAKNITGVLVTGETYTLHEVYAPDGYVIAADKEFTVPDSADAFSVTMTDKRIGFIKEDQNHARLNGARFAIYDVEDMTTPIETWQTTQDVHYISGLAYGKSYVIKETYTPQGYRTAADITFTVNDALFTTNVITFTAVDEDDVKTIELTKTDLDGVVIPAGAKFGLFKDAGARELISEKEIKDGKVSWTVLYGLLAPEQVKVDSTYYYVKETVAPVGYALNNHIYEIRIDNSTRKVYIDGTEIAGSEVYNTVNPITAKDTPTEISFAKVEVVDGVDTYLPATFEITEPGNKDFEKITFSTTTAQPIYTVVNKLTANHTYVVTETVAPEGYLFADPITFTVTDDDSGKMVVIGQTETDLIRVIDRQTEVTFMKKDAEDESKPLLPGAMFEIWTPGEDGEKVAEFTTEEGKPSVVKKLHLDTTYVLKEIKAPDGYYPAADTTFTIKRDGSSLVVLVDEEAVDAVVVKDEQTVVYFDKVDDNDEALAGAKFDIIDKDGNVVHSWESDGTSHEVKNILIVGETYTLTETYAPDGYLYSEDIVFTVDSTPEGSFVKIGEEEFTTVTVIDPETKVTFVKSDTEDEEALLGGAVFEIWTLGSDDEEGAPAELVETFETVEGEPSVIHKLHLNTTYVLKEVKAPDGYYLADDVTFSLEGHTELTVLVDEEPVDAVIVNDDQTVIYVEKVDEKGNALSGAQLKVVDKDGKVVDNWTTDGKPHEIKGKLVAGETYTLKEVYAPNGYMIAKDITFTVDEKMPEDKIVIKMVDTKSPNTGVHTNSTFYGVTLLGSLAVMLQILRRRKED